MRYLLWPSIIMLPIALPWQTAIPLMAVLAFLFWVDGIRPEDEKPRRRVR